MQARKRSLGTPIKTSEHFLNQEKSDNPKSQYQTNSYRKSNQNPIRRKSDNLLISTNMAIKISDKNIPAKGKFDSSKILKTMPENLDKKNKPLIKRREKKSSTFKFDKQITLLYKNSVKSDQNEKHRDYMEDVTLVQSNFNNDANKNLYCIFDGHGGEQTAKMSCKRFPEILKKNIDDSPFDIEKALRKTFCSLDKEIETFLRVGDVGNTLTCVLIINGTLYCANVGDSSCVLVTQKGAEMISVDHKCTNMDEIKRIQKMGGIINEDRLNGILAISRCIGDFDLKDKGLICEPYIYKRLIEKTDRYLVLASDGVWDVLRPNDIKEICEENIDVDLISDEIIVEAKEFGSEDNISVIVIELNKGIKMRKKSYEL